MADISNCFKETNIQFSRCVSCKYHQKCNMEAEFTEIDTKRLLEILPARNVSVDINCNLFEQALNIEEEIKKFANNYDHYICEKDVDHCGVQEGCAQCYSKYYLEKYNRFKKDIDRI